jgi:pyrrolidone-carboxylate peptidase
VSAPFVTVAAFEPFGGRRRNCAEEAARHLSGSSLQLRGQALPVQIASLPTVFARLDGALRQLLEARPSALVLVGESAALQRPALEALALNVAWARIPDNAGERPRGSALLNDAPLALACRWAEPLVERLRAEGHGVDLSFHAGTFCCNAALYRALALTRERPLPLIFVHVPAQRPHARRDRAAALLRAAATALLEVRAVDEAEALAVSDARAAEPVFR